MYMHGIGGALLGYMQHVFGKDETYLLTDLLGGFDLIEKLQHTWMNSR